MVVCFFFLEIHVVFSVPSVVPPKGHLLGDLRRLISFNLSVSVANSCLLPQSDEEKGLKNTSGTSFGCEISHFGCEITPKGRGRT